MIKAAWLDTHLAMGLKGLTVKCVVQLHQILFALLCGHRWLVDFLNGLMGKTAECANEAILVPAPREVEHR